MVKIKCGWGDCLKEYEFYLPTGNLRSYGRGNNVCPHCGRLNKSSHKDSIEHSSIKHIHRELKAGDVV